MATTFASHDMSFREELAVAPAHIDALSQNSSLCPCLGSQDTVKIEEGWLRKVSEA